MECIQFVLADLVCVLETVMLLAELTSYDQAFDKGVRTASIVFCGCLLPASLLSVTIALVYRKALTTKTTADELAVESAAHSESNDIANDLENPVTSFVQ